MIHTSTFQQPISNSMMKVVLAIIFLLSASALTAHSKAPEEVHLPSVQRTKDCPVGTELVGKQCVSTEVLEPNYVCSPGTTSVNGECASFSRASRVCPEETSSAGEECLAKKKVPPSYVCDEGVLDGNRCRITTEVPPVCPAGLQQRDGECLRLSQVQKVCPAGYQSHPEGCIKQVTQPASPSCPTDFSLADGDRCIKSVPVPPRCATGFSMVNTECVKQVAKVDAECPHGYSALGSECRRVQEFPARLVCPAEFTFVDGQCVQEVPVAPTCPSGTSRNSSGRCERVVPSYPVCDSGEDLVADRCKRSSLFQSELRCIAGYHIVHGKCKKVTKEAPVLRCSSGVLTDGQCITQTTSIPLLQCPSGYKLAKGPKCVKSVSYDCSKSIVQNECDMPAFVREISDLRQLHADYKVKISTPSYSKTGSAKDYESKTPKCAPVSRQVAQTCNKIEEIAVEQTCGDGSSPINDSCLSTQRASPGPYCRAGQFDRATGQCITIDVVPSERVCSTGRLQADGSCLLIEEKPATLVCPEGSHRVSIDSCVTSEPEVSHPNRVVRRAPEVICEFGRKEGRICLLSDIIQREKVCPSGAEHVDGGCVSKSSPIAQEPRIVSQPASYVCSDKSQTRGKSCVRNEIIPATYICHDGGVQEGSRCVQTAPLIHFPAQVVHAMPRSVCPREFQMDDQQCISITRIPAQLQCPADYLEYKSGAQECIRPHARIAICPSGTQQTHSGCIKKSYSPPRVTEIKVCTKGQPGC